jgi:AraC-like DNA-binding protein
MAIVDTTMLLVLVALMALRLLQIRPSALFPRPDAVTGAAGMAAPSSPAATLPPGAEPPDPAEDRLALALEQLMSAERAYRDEALTIAGLAARLGTPEYRLRRLINRRLGHRNFNAYVNAFRLDEARRWLADPAQREVPVTTIALDAGFGSIGPFNRAFKAATGTTPTAYRQQSLGETGRS